MTKTILQELIDKIEEIREQESNVLSEESSYHPNDVKQARLIFTTCQNVINKVRELLPKEKIRLVDSFDEGQANWDEKCQDFKNGSEYFDKCYGVS